MVEELVDAAGPMLGEFIDDDAISGPIRERSGAPRRRRGRRGRRGRGAAAGNGRRRRTGSAVPGPRGIILAFAGKVLLKPTNLRLVRGRRYGVVGQNGAGKTTLLTRLAAGDINGWPEDLRCVFVQHEVLVTLEETILGFHDRAARRPWARTRGRPTVPGGSRLHSRSHGEDGDANSPGAGACDWPSRVPCCRRRTSFFLTSPPTTLTAAPWSGWPTTSPPWSTPPSSWSRTTTISSPMSPRTSCTSRIRS